MQKSGSLRYEINYLLIPQMEVTFHPWKGHLKLKIPKKVTRKNLGIPILDSKLNQAMDWL